MQAFARSNEPAPRPVQGEEHDEVRTVEFLQGVQGGQVGPFDVPTVRRQREDLRPATLLDCRDDLDQISPEKRLTSGERIPEHRPNFAGCAIQRLD